MSAYFPRAYASQSYSTLAQVVRSSLIAGSQGFGLAGNTAERGSLAQIKSQAKQAAIDNM